MSDVICSVDEFSETLANALSQFSDEETHEIKDIITQSATDCAKNIKTDAPKRASTGNKYAKGWTCHKDGEANLDIQYTIYNKSQPSLTHLLENGHAKINGGRVEGIPHIAPNEKKMEQEIDKKINEMDGD